MGRSSFVQPDVIRLPLSEGEWVDVKRELNAGEQRRVFSKLVKEMHFGEKAAIDPEQVGFSKLVEYLVGWSLTDADGKPVPVSESAINNLTADRYGEIVKAVDAHEETFAKELETRKNAKGDGIKSNPTLSSVA